jgi:PKD repeat protein
LLVAMCCLASAASAAAAQAATTVTVGANSANAFAPQDVTITTGQITVLAPPPVAKFTTSPAPAYAGHPVTFDGSASTAATGGKVVSYIWNFGDSTPPTTTSTPTTTHTYAASGSYTATLTVVDDQGTDSQPASHAVRIAVDRPTAQFTVKPATTTPGKTVAFNGSASKDPDGDSIAAYQWSFGDGTTLTTASATTTHIYNAIGTFKPTLTVLDSRGNPSTTVTRTVTIKAPPGKPIGSFTFSPAHPVIGQTVTFNASTSTDPNGFPITSYRWSWGDAVYPTPPVTATPIATHAYSHSGTFIVRLVVTDSHGLKSVSIAHKVVVSRPLPPPPPRLSQLHVRVCKHRSRFCAHRGIKVRFTLTAAGHVTLKVRQLHHRRLLRNRVVTVGPGSDVVYLRLGHLRPARYVLGASVFGGNGAGLVFRVRRH